MKFCSECGQSVTARVPDGDTRSRFICDHCETIHYQNPRIVAGCLAVHERQVLLCKRAIEPRMGYWTLPAGFMENGETTEEAALRETWEEARARLQSQQLYMLFNLPHINQVYISSVASWPIWTLAPAKKALKCACFMKPISPGMNWPSRPSAKR